ncbi:ATP-binding protein [Candidatus Thorarchaeota archaeon]|nr:MAG: ATP-binding protein [Candidatus Thorarchaeota archaeon]
MIPAIKDSLLGEIHVGALEVTEIPESYMTDEETQPGKTLDKSAFASALRAMIVSRLPVGLRIERVRGTTRVFFLTWTRQAEKLRGQLDALAAAAGTHLSELVLKRHSRFKGLRSGNSAQGVTACLVGAPGVESPIEGRKSESDVMDGAGEALQLVNNGLLQVFITPTKYSSGKMRTLENDYESALERSHKTVSSHRGVMASQESRTRVNAEAVREAERLQKQLKRLRSRYLGKVSVCVTLWASDRKTAEQQAHRLASVLVGGVTPSDPDEDIQIVLKKSQRDFERALAGRPLGDETVLTPEEASIYFSLPRCDLGIKVFRSSSFSSAVGQTEAQDTSVGVQEPVNDDKKLSDTALTRDFLPRSKVDTLWKIPEDVKKLILMGYILRNRVPQKLRPYGLVGRVIGRHIGVFGDSGTGKTTTAISIAAQAYRNNIIPTILVPGNAKDWRVLKDLYDEFRIFTAGNPDLAPLRYNMWDVPPGVSVSRYIDRMVDVHIAALPTDGVLSMHLRDVFQTMYERCGWSRLSNVRGRSILLTDLYEAMQEVATKHLKYGDDLRKDFYGALEARVRSMLRNDILVDMFNTPTGLSIPELLAHPTIIEMRDLSPENMVLLTGALTVGINEYMTANPARQVGQMLVLEEAHHLVRRVQGPTGYAEPTARQTAIDNIIGMLREQRKNGLGIMLIDQLPGSMAEEAVKLPSSVIIHTLTDPQERALVGGQASCTVDQMRHLGVMGVGEVVAKIPLHELPANIQVAPLPYLVNVRLPRRDWTDAAVREAMQPVFEDFPELRESYPLTQEMHDILRGKISVPTQVEVAPRLQVMGISQRPEADIGEIVSAARFADEYVSRADLAAHGDPLPVTRLLVTVAGKFCSSEEDPVPLAERLLLHAAGMLQAPTDTSVLADILVAIRSHSV